MLTQMRKSMQINRGLVSIGKTRFATIYWAAQALAECLPAIRSLIEEGTINNIRVCQKGLILVDSTLT